MLSKGQIKLITSLQRKKYRQQKGLFIAEGPKVIQELLSENMKLHSLFTTDGSVSHPTAELISKDELTKISCLTTANSCLAVFQIPETPEVSSTGLTIALDAVRDPGNLGTIIRLCDWFGVAQLICSMDTVDCYNPKVVQATMGSIARVAITYLDLPRHLQATKQAVFGGVMSGKSIYKEALPENAVIVLGNEANGISSEVEKALNHRISIPQFGKIHATESLNVATAAAILLSEFKRFTET